MEKIKARMQIEKRGNKRKLNYILHSLDIDEIDLIRL